MLNWCDTYKKISKKNIFVKFVIDLMMIMLLLNIEVKYIQQSGKQKIVKALFLISIISYIQ